MVRYSTDQHRKHLIRIHNMVDTKGFCSIEQFIRGREFARRWLPVLVRTYHK